MHVGLGRSHWRYHGRLWYTVLNRGGVMGYLCVILTLCFRKWYHLRVDIVLGRCFDVVFDLVFSWLLGMVLPVLFRRMLDLHFLL